MRHRTRILNLIATLTSIAAILLSSFLPEVAELSKYYIFAFIIVLVGIPHGAVDHIVSSRIYNLSNEITDQIKFYVPYLLLILIMGFTWYLTPIIGFIIFLMTTIYHFGQADIERLKFPNKIKLPLYISRGVMLMGLVIFVKPSVSFPIMETIMGIDISTKAIAFEFNDFFSAIAVAQHFILLILVLISFQNHSKQKVGYIVGDAVLTASLFWFSEPIIAFAIYFGCWHSLGHIEELQHFLSSQNKHWDITEFIKDAWLFTTLSIFGLFVLYKLNQSFGSEEQMLALLFILISALTLPHMIVVELMYKNDKRNKISQS